MMGVFVQINGDSQYARSRPVGYVIQENGCWQWTGAHTRATGYGYYHRPNGQHCSAHRLFYERYKGPVPAGRQIYHLCRNTGCVNPDHMEAVTARVNTLRGTSIPAKNARKEYCTRGHKLTPENTHTKQNGQRQCRICQRDRNRVARSGMPRGWKYNRDVEPRVLDALAAGKVCVKDMMAVTGLSRKSVAHALERLRRKNLVANYRRRQWGFATLDAGPTEGSER